MADPVADFLAREQDMLAEIEGGAPPAPGPGQFSLFIQRI